MGHTVNLNLSLHIYPSSFSIRDQYFCKYKIRFHLTLYCHYYIYLGLRRNSIMLLKQVTLSYKIELNTKKTCQGPLKVSVELTRPD